MNEIGSIWRRWDFHVHTPYSLLNNEFGDCDDEEIWDKYVHTLYVKAISLSIGAIFLTDYFIIEGYEKVVSIIKNQERMKKIFANEIKKDSNFLTKVNKIAIFPNIEFRTSDTINQNKVQVHVLFSNELASNTIKKYFLKMLYCDLSGNKWYCDLDDLKKLGEYCDERGIGNLVGHNRLKLGMNNFSVKIDDVKKYLEDKRFEGKYIIVSVVEDLDTLNWQNQSGSLRVKYRQLSQAVFTSNDNNIKWFKSEECEKTIGKTLPCITGSDCHNFEDMFESNNLKYCWVKSDTTFRGLKDSLKNSEERIYIGEKPIDIALQEKRKSYTIKSIDIYTDSLESQKHWINGHLDFNPGMISIIGNKGSGKSAISDIISYLGNTSKESYFSFLRRDRFFDKTNKYANNYKGYLTFYDGAKTEEKIIKENGYDSEKIERVMYLPQRYIENTCNDINRTYFKNEIEGLIFSYIDDLDKNGCKNLTELINKKFSTINIEIETLKVKINDINKDIVEKERKLTLEFRNHLSLNKQEILQKIENHKRSKPEQIEKPLLDDNNKYLILYSRCSQLKKTVLEDHNMEYTKYEKITDELNSIDYIINIENEVKKRIIELNNLYKNHNDQYNLDINCEVSLVKNEEKEFNEYYKRLNDDQAKLREKLVKIDNESSIYDIDNTKYEEIENKIKLISNYFAKEAAIDEIFEELSKKISTQQAQYQANQEEIKKWDLIDYGLKNGNSIIPYENSLKGIQTQIDYVNNELPNEINKLKNKQIELINELYEKLVLKRNSLRELYEAVQNKVNSVLEDGLDKMTFDSVIAFDSALIKKIDMMVNHRVSSKYSDLSYLENIVPKIDFNDKQSTISFIKEQFGNLCNDLNCFYKNMLKDNNQVDFYNLLSKLDYLSVQYDLKMNNKALDQLSPGEKGIVLLIFYLALDKGNKTLIIDQPEDNLDNQSIFERLTKLIVMAKKNRQIIVVTHNPNIAVACDSEQIIYASIDQNTNKISYESGSIENPTISKHIVDVLEGTLPAFCYRESKYDVGDK